MVDGISRPSDNAPMPEPLAICIEDLDAPATGRRYVRCVALPGGLPGLAVTPEARILWKEEGDQAFQLWISADDRLILLRPEGAPPVRVERAGRGVNAPFAKPVVLIDQDLVTVGSKRLRIHVHGVAEVIHSPSPLKSRLAGAARLAAAAALGAAAIGCKIDIRDHPPEPVYVPPPDSGDAGGPPDADAGDEVDAETGIPDAPDDAQPDADAAEGGSRKADASKTPIEVRVHPPKPVSRQ